ncbi:biotin--acetyl-CoA-carboxylase ligase [Petrotoga sp. 9PW.55.5.1]|uniref:biotin--[acetyl-CoA-carboxylase] ligase n=1 Tax=Petrotoga sp. 9PW.55.5.1 TaxID=1308979 RepID=UPI000DC450AE|nr:biotin--[acetyl-CoA-carboxylase] ligase [Petrotoga sp. 9PW.55.5.1]RAO98878.1 biotin--acetyl-CoA-carboxylase ligase [Petrotoga sp. 9PW.55.5.1]
MIGDNLIVLDKVDSTNIYIKNHWIELPSETVVWALEQTQGYGRKKDRWYSPLGGLWFSVLFKPRKRPLIPYYYVRMYSLVIYDILKNKYNLNPIIKWPNDILVDEKKICGILGESIYKGTYPACVVVGIGLNVNNELPNELKDYSTSLKNLLGKELSLRKLLTQINHIAYHSYYLKYFKAKSISAVTKIWLKRLNIKNGDPVKIKDQNTEIISGRIKEIHSDYLEILDDSGKSKKYYSGDISLLNKYG